MKTKRRHLGLAWLSALLAMATGLALVGGEFAAHHWLLNLFPSFQAQYAGLLFFAALGLLASGKKTAALVTALVLVLPAGRVLSLWTDTPTPTLGPHLRVVTFNVLISNRRHEDVIDWLLREDADLLLLLETDQSWRESLDPLKAHYPYRAANFDAGTTSFAFFSKFPLADTKTHSPGGTPLLETTGVTPSGPLRLFGAHPLPPMGPELAAGNDAYLTELADLADATEGPAIIMGDLNASRWSPTFKHLTAAGFEDSTLGFGYQATWHRRNPLLAIPIDHVLFRDLPRPSDREIGPDLGSDHRPVTVDFPTW